MQVIIGSHNPVKIETVKQAFAQVFPDADIHCEGYAADSGVADQPMGDEETRQGAYNRAAACRETHPDADYCVGLEGGVIVDGDNMWSTAWMCVVDRNRRAGYGKTGMFLLPPQMAELIRSGVEMGHATDQMFGQTNSKQKTATIGMLTGDTITRTDFYRDAVVFALIPLINPELY